MESKAVFFVAQMIAGWCWFQGFLLELSTLKFGADSKSFLTNEHFCSDGLGKKLQPR